MVRFRTPGSGRMTWSVVSVAGGRQSVYRRSGLGPANTYLSASKMSTKWMKPMNITSSFSNRENIRR